jgi:hypothetical protein
MTECIELVRFRVKPGEDEQVVRTHAGMVSAVRQRFPGLVEARLGKLPDGTYIDVVVYSSAAEAEAANEDALNIPEFVEMVSHIEEVVSIEQLEAIDRL